MKGAKYTLRVHFIILDRRIMVYEGGNKQALQVARHTVLRMAEALSLTLQMYTEVVL